MPCCRVQFLVLYCRELVRIDEIRYTANMHSPLLSSDEGVSLEKVSPELSSGVPGNWHSASETAGWGTPGAPNSVLSDQLSGKGEVELSSSRITPDDDGIEEVLAIGFNLKGIGNVVNVTVFDENGSYIRKLAGNLSVGQGSELIWDGRAADGSMLDTGIYILLIEAYSESGRTSRWKKVCTIIRR